MLKIVGTKNIQTSMLIFVYLDLCPIPVYCRVLGGAVYSWVLGSLWPHWAYLALPVVLQHVCHTITSLKIGTLAEKNKLLSSQPRVTVRSCFVYKVIRDL